MRLHLVLGRDVHRGDVLLSDLAVGGHTRMMHVTEPIVPVAEAAPAKTARTVANEVGDDAADPNQADDADDQADPFRVRGGKRQ